MKSTRRIMKKETHKNKTTSENDAIQPENILGFQSEANVFALELFLFDNVENVVQFLNPL